MDQIVLRAKIFYPKNRTQLHNGKIKFRHNITSKKAKPLRNLDYIENGQFFLDFLLHYQMIMDFLNLLAWLIGWKWERKSHAVFFLNFFCRYLTSCFFQDFWKFCKLFIASQSFPFICFERSMSTKFKLLSVLRNHE